MLPLPALVLALALALALAAPPPAAAGDPAATAQAEEPALFLVRLEPGPRRDPGRTLDEEPGAAEARTWARDRIREGALALAGQVGDDPVLILRAPHVEAALRVVESNPLVRAGALRHRIEPLAVYFAGSIPVRAAPEPPGAAGQETREKH